MRNLLDAPKKEVVAGEYEGEPKYVLPEATGEAFQVLSKKKLKWIDDKNRAQPQNMVVVPQKWMEALLQHAIDADEALKKYDHAQSNLHNDRIIVKCHALKGYAKSAGNIIKNNKFEEIDQNQ